jgi:hypothetical protein
MNASHWVKLSDAVLEGVELCGSDQVDLVEHKDVCKRNLLLALGARSEMHADVARIDECYNPVKLQVALDLVVNEKGLGNWPGVCEPSGFDDHPVEPIAPLQKTAENPYQVTTNAAADAAVAKLEYFLLGVNHQRLIHAYVT